MPALEIRQDEIGRFDYQAHKARRARMWSKAPIVRKPQPVADPDEAIVSPQSEPILLVENVRRDWLILNHKKICEWPKAPVNVPSRRLRIDEIIKICAHAYGVSVNDILSPRRAAHIVRPRQEAMWLSKRFTIRSLTEIGRLFGGRDHTTVLHAVRKIDALIAEGSYEPRALSLVKDFEARLSAAAVDFAAALVEG